MNNQLKGRLWLMGFGLNLSAAVIHLVLHSYTVMILAFLISYFCFDKVSQEYIDRVSDETLGGNDDSL